MQIIRSDKLLCLLRYFSILGGQQLRADRSIQYVKQDIPQRLILSVIRFVQNYMSYKRFGNGCVHAVHAHVISVVRRPAQSQLGQIARADDYTARLIRNIHYDLRTFARLRVLIGNVVYITVVPYV